MWIKKPLAIALLFASTQAYSAYSLMDVYQMSLQHDAVLAQAKAKFEADKQVVTTARAPLLPQISASGTYGKNSSSDSTGNVTTRDLSVTVNQSLYKKDNWARYDQSKFQLKSAQ
jgi:outer membrane protein